MLYTSTQNNKESVSSAQAIAQGISRDGGLFVPETFPVYDGLTFETLLRLDYRERAKKILSDYLTDFTAEEIEKIDTYLRNGGNLQVYFNIE